MNNKSVSELLLDEIERLGVTKVFLVPGANISFFVNQLVKRSNIDMVIANHELAAGFMAIGYAQASGTPGVVCSIGSPGIAYLAGAAMTAETEGIPLLCISGNIPEHSWGRGEFQDGSPQGTNDTEMLQSILGLSQTCRKAEDITDILSSTHDRLLSSRPAHIQLPIDVQSTPARDTPTCLHPPGNPDDSNPVTPPHADLRRRTVLAVGQQAVDILDTTLLAQVVSRHAIGIITDINSRGVVDESSRQALGHIGFNSSRKAISALDNTSSLATENLFVVGLGNSLCERYFNNNPHAIRIAPEAANAWLKQLAQAEALPQEILQKHTSWLNELQQVTTFTLNGHDYSDKVSYSELIDTCRQVLPSDTIYCLDSGQIRRAGNMMLKAHTRRTILQSNSLSPMGLGICASIGAKSVFPHRPVVALFGDGSMRMHGTEIATAQRYRLPVIFILCDNRSLSSVPMDENLKALPPVNWEKFAYSFGVQSLFATNRTTFAERLRQALKAQSPALLWTWVPDLLEHEINITTSTADASWLSQFQTQ